jgi:hypothetical protein
VLALSNAPSIPCIVCCGDLIVVNAALGHLRFEFLSIREKRAVIDRAYNAPISAFPYRICFVRTTSVA